MTNYFVPWFLLFICARSPQILPNLRKHIFLTSRKKKKCVDISEDIVKGKK